MATIQDMIQPIQLLLGNRSDVPALATQAVANSIIELSDNYPFEELRETGPLVELTPGQSQYAIDAFLVQVGVTPGPPPSLQHTLGKPVSWYLYYNYSTNPNTYNTGYNLTFRDIEDIETLINIQTSIPQFWSWLGDSLYLASTPVSNYTTYLRYQYLHPFTSPIALNTDTILLPPTWYDVIQYSAAERIALQLRMSDVADRYHIKLHGDPKNPKNLGLISARTSQTTKNQSRSTRSMRPMMSRY